MSFLDSTANSFSSCPYTRATLSRSLSLCAFSSLLFFSLLLFPNTNSDFSRYRQCLSRNSLWYERICIRCGNKNWKSFRNIHRFFFLSTKAVDSFHQRVRSAKKKAVIPNVYRTKKKVFSFSLLFHALVLARTFSHGHLAKNRIAIHAIRSPTYFSSFLSNIYMGGRWARMLHTFKERCV